MSTLGRRVVAGVADPGPRSATAATAAFTIIELVVVISIIIILAGLILATTGYVQKKGARSRAETEIAAMSAAMESYKADNGIYPRGNANLGSGPPYDTDNLNAQSAFNPSGYQSASLFLYKTLSGDTNANLQPPAGAKVYFSFRPQMLGGTKDANGNLTAVTYIRDPFGNSYGYSTANQANSSNGYNPTYDFWSTAGGTGLGDVPGWVKNW
jgi:type II secretory pathway pseudopilin PulG